VPRIASKRILVRCEIGQLKALEVSFSPLALFESDLDSGYASVVVVEEIGCTCLDRLDFEKEGV
jgi:hypothetical protein